MLKKKIFVRFLIIDVIIVSLYTFLITGILGYKSNQISYLENDYSNKVFIKQISDELDYKLDTSIKFIDEVSSIETIVNYLNSDEIDYATVTCIYNELSKNLKTFDQLGFSIGVTKLQNDLVIAPQGTYKYKDFLRKIHIKEEYLDSLENSFLKKESKNQYFIIPQKMQNENSDYLTIVRKVKYYSDSNSTLFYFASFDKTDILPKNLPNSNGNFIISTNDIIASTFIPVNNNLKSVNYTGKDGSIDIIKSDHKYLNYVSQSKVLKELTYNYCINQCFLKSDLTKIIKNIFIFNVLLLFLGICIIYKATKSTYEPIRNILGYFDPNLENSSLDELTFIRENIENINTSNEDMKKTIKDSLIQIQENFFRNILYGLISEESISKKIKELELHSYEAGGIVSILDFDGISEFETNFSKEKITTVRMNLLSTFNENENLVPFLVVPFNHKRYCLIFNSQLDASVMNTLTHLIETLEAELSLEIIASLSQKVTSIFEIQSAFQDALKLIEYKYSAPYLKIVTNTNIKYTKEDSYFYPIEAENCLIQYINNGEQSKASELLETILDKNLIQSNLYSVNLRNFRYALTNTMKRILNEHDKSLKEFTSKNSALFNGFEETSGQVLKKDILILFTTLFNECKSDLLNLSNPTVANILIYIQQNYDKDISLTNLSNHFNLSEGYISKLVNSALNVSFKSYLNGLRVKKAKELLSKGIYKVNEVGKAVGCDNTNTFIRIFKKHEGVSPGEYVKSLI